MNIKEWIGFIIILWVFIKFAWFLLESWEYKNLKRLQNNGTPRAYYPKLKKPQFIKFKK